jgi:release factor glutamine methyltransferase
VNIAEALAGDPAARLDRRLLLQHVLGRGHAWLAAHPEQVLTSSEEIAFAALLDRRAVGEPVAYLVGHREFYGLDFRVTPDVLIPRPETELLVDWALEITAGWSSGTVLDLGTGSGAIAIALQAHRPRLRVIAADRSAAALAVARDNAARLLPAGWAGSLEFVESDWFEMGSDHLAGKVGKMGSDHLATAKWSDPFANPFNLIVSNPPYVAEGDPHLGQGDVRFEPRGALTAGPDGLDAIRVLASQAPKHLAAGGWLLLEHGYDQQAACQSLLTAAGFRQVSTRFDLAGQPRVTSGGWLPPLQE